MDSTELVYAEIVSKRPTIDRLLADSAVENNCCIASRAVSVRVTKMRRASCGSRFRESKPFSSSVPIQRKAVVLGTPEAMHKLETDSARPRNSAP